MRSECLRLSCGSILSLAKATMNCLLRSYRSSRLMESTGPFSRHCLAKILIVSRCRERESDCAVDLSTSPTVIGWAEPQSAGGESGPCFCSVDSSIRLSELRSDVEDSDKRSLAVTGDHLIELHRLRNVGGLLATARSKAPRVRRCHIYRLYRRFFESLNPYFMGLFHFAHLEPCSLLGDAQAGALVCSCDAPSRMNSSLKKASAFLISELHWLLTGNQWSPAVGSEAWLSRRTSFLCVASLGVSSDLPTSAGRLGAPRR